MTAALEYVGVGPSAGGAAESGSLANDASAQALAGLVGDLGFKDASDPEVREGVVAMYGSAFPLLRPKPREQDWVTWAETLWDRHTAGMQARLHLVERNRLFRKGVQWISSVGMGPWREPERPRDAARVVENVVKPALDQRIQLLREQKPGFNCRPASHDPQDLKKAEAQQIALEYQYDQQGMSDVQGEASFWAGTDGVAFLELYWDANAGPWNEYQAEAPPPQQQGGATSPAMPQAPPPPQRFPLGDVKTRVRRIEHVRVSADAKATKPPWYWVLREAIPMAVAAKEYGAEAAAQMTRERPESRLRLGTVPAQRLGFLLPEEEELFREQELVDRMTVHCEKSEFLEKGLTLVVVGRKLAYLGPLVCGRVPLVRYPDGSTDPAFYPEPIMDAWIDSQMRINGVKSKWVENVRLNAGPRLIAKENAIAGETLVGGTMSVISVKGIGTLSEAVRPLEGFSLAEDAKELLASERKAFEDLSGWNDASRGAFSEEQSGRAVLAIRESLERIFAPPINAAAAAMTEWAKVTLAWMAWGYDLPRKVSVEGKSRVDLARSLSSEDFDGVADVWIDPETMMPMPRSLRLFLLKDMYANHLIGPAEMRRRLPFAWVRDLGSPDEDQEARARRCAEALRSGQQLQVLWQDNEAIHQDVLERELILPDDTPPPIRQAASDRWQQLAQQAAMKQAAMQPAAQEPGMPPYGAPSPQPPGLMQGQLPPGGLAPGQQPFAGTAPPIAAGQNPVPGTAGGAGPLQMGGVPDATAAAAEFDQRTPY